MNHSQYVHGYSSKESKRLQDQAQTLADLLHHDTIYPADSRVLEVGCGIGAQRGILAKNNPQNQILSLDISSESVTAAKARLEEA